MAFWTYMLRCADGSYYTGHTDDLGRRVGDHINGNFPGYTRSRWPVTLVWSEFFGTRYEAKANEAQIKGWSRAKKEALIRGDYCEIARLARKRV